MNCNEKYIIYIKEDDYYIYNDIEIPIEEYMKYRDDEMACELYKLKRYSNISSLIADINNIKTKNNIPF